MGDVLSRLRSALAGRYTLERELGRGGMATVWLAHDEKHDRPVALKVLRPELAAALGPERFLREIHLTARLTHPHILPLHDSGVADGFLFYVMPYVEGESLRDRLNREKQLPLDDALQIAREVADALSYAHSHDVVHRDIKPENILLEAGHAVVADFGIARAITAAGGEKLTETGMAVGTPAYMSPEQGAGSRELDGRSDLYSLGCVLYEMLAGRPPFVGATAESVVRQHLVAEPPAITSIRPAVPAAVAAALSRALAKTPADRFNPVALFGEALRGPAALAVMPTGPAGTRVAASARARRVGAVAVLAVFLALAGAWAAVRIAGRVRGDRAAPAFNAVGNLIPDSVAHAVHALGIVAAGATLRYVFAPHNESVGNALIITDSQLIRVEPGRTRAHPLHSIVATGFKTDGTVNDVWVSLDRSPWSDTLFVGLNHREAGIVRDQLQRQLGLRPTRDERVVDLPPPALDAPDSLVPDSVLAVVRDLGVVPAGERVRYVFTPHGGSVHNSVIVTDSQLIRIEPGRVRSHSLSRVEGVGSAGVQGGNSVYVQISRTPIRGSGVNRDASGAFADSDTLFAALNRKEQVVLFERLWEQVRRANPDE